MSELVGEHIRTLKAYVPGKPIEELERELGITNCIKLASNENPLGPSPRAVEAIHSAVENLHIYPDGAAFNLRAKLASKCGVAQEEVMLGNGSNELLTLAVRAFCQPSDNVVVSDYAFVAYRVVSTAAGIPIKSIPMTDGYIHDLDAMAKACDEDTKIVFVANPNNPTGTYVGRKAIEKFLTDVPPHVIVLMDEAYVEYALAEDYVSALEFWGLRERLLITRTFSKCYGLAGLRCGFALGPAELIGFMNRIREPFNANSLAQVGALAALDDEAFIAWSVRSNEDGRKRLVKGLSVWADRGVNWIPSQTNFLLVGTPVEGQKIYDSMLRSGVIVRPMAGYGLVRYLRITIGAEDEIERCLAAFGKALNEVGA